MEKFSNFILIITAHQVKKKNHQKNLFLSIKDERILWRVT